MKSFLRYVALVVALAVAAVWWAKPGYLELDIPVVAHKGGGPFWWETQRAELAYADSAGVLYLYRRVGTAYPDTQGWKTIEEVFAYFDAQLGQRGWSHHFTIDGDSAVPESRLLTSSNLKSYRRSEPSKQEPEIVIAVWPIGGGIVEGFNVVLTTQNPSLLRRLSDAFDD
ncbi:hypothetical protein ACO2JO_18170 [Leptospira interrogans]